VVLFKAALDVANFLRGVAKIDDGRREAAADRDSLEKEGG
jgi:hypothetical protein